MRIMKKTLRQTITNAEKTAGNLFYDGAGDVLATEMNPRGIIGLGLLGAVAFGSLGCAGSLFVEGPRFKRVLTDLKKENIYESICSDVGGNAVKFYDKILKKELKEHKKNNRYLELNPETYYFQVWKPQYLKSKK